MYNYLAFRDYVFIVFTSMLKTIIIFAIVFFIIHLGMYNHSLGISIANFMNIPYDMALTVNSLGFANNITVVFTVIDLIVIGLIINQLNKFRTMNKIFTSFCDFISIY